MRNLLLSSYILLFSSCGTTPYLFLEESKIKEDCISAMIPAFKTELYNAQINVTGKHLSGLLLFKNMGDSSSRVVFTSETGLTMFDFEFGKKEFKVIYCIDKLNKKPVINQLRKDIGLILRYEMTGTPEKNFTGKNELYFGYNNKNETTWYITGNDCTSINRIETASKKKRKVIVNLYGYGTTMPDTVYLDHQLFEFNISLQKIKR